MPIISVSDLRKHYGEQLVLDDVSFDVEEGEIFGILGPNGAGKTTTVECLAGLRVPDSGEVRVAGLDPRTDRMALTQVLGMQLQHSELPDRMRVAEALELYGSFYTDPADRHELLADLGLRDKADTRFDRLSGGQRQRLSIALALVGNPRVAVLDELTTGLDPVARRDTWTLIERVRDRGVTVVLVTHFMAEAEYLCDRLALIADGRVVATDSPAGLVARLGAEQTVRFRPSGPFDENLLRELPEVDSVHRRGDRVVVRGAGNLVLAVAATLATHQVVATDLRAEQADLDDAFIALTGRRLDPTP